jgi:Ala-tRNA(Pro) deacylase
VTPSDLLTFLSDHGISYERLDHEPLMTCEDVARVMPAGLEAVHTKNLFVRDKKGRRHWLVVTVCEKPVDLKRVTEIAGADNLSFASPDRLMRHLGVTPGAVTVLGLVHDETHAVSLLVDRDVWAAERLCCHPLVNDATLVLTHQGLARFLAATGHEPRVIEVPTRD